MSRRVRIVHALLVAGVLPCAVPAYAQEEEAEVSVEAADSAGLAGAYEPGASYIGGMGILRETDREFVDYGAGLNFFYGTVRDEKWNHEWSFSMNVLETDSSFSDFYRYGFGWDALYFLDRDGIQPYLVGGLGLVHNERLDIAGGDETSGYLNLGVGFVTQPLNKYGIALRGAMGHWCRHRRRRRPGAASRWWRRCIPWRADAG